MEQRMKRLLGLVMVVAIGLLGVYYVVFLYQSPQKRTLAIGPEVHAPLVIRAGLVNEVVGVSQFNKLLEMSESQKAPAIVKFHATWCSVCTSMKKHDQALSGIFKDRAIFAQVDVDQDRNKELIKTYGVRGVPTYLFFLNKELSQQLVGFIEPERYEKIVKDLVDKASQK